MTLELQHKMPLKKVLSRSVDVNTFIFIAICFRQADTNSSNSRHLPRPLAVIINLFLQLDLHQDDPVSDQLEPPPPLPANESRRPLGNRSLRSPRGPSSLMANLYALRQICEQSCLTGSSGFTATLCSTGVFFRHTAHLAQVVGVFPPSLCEFLYRVRHDWLQNSYGAMGKRQTDEPAG